MPQSYTVSIYSVHDPIKEIASINKIIEIKRYGIKVNYDDLLVNKNVLDRIKLIRKQIHLNLLEINTVQELDIYEKHVNSLLQKGLFSTRSSNHVDDEIEFINHCKPFSKEEFRSYNINIDLRNKHIVYMQDVHSSDEELISLISNPERIEIVQTKNSTRSYLVLSKFEFKSKITFVLAHLSVSRDDDRILYIVTCFYFQNTDINKLTLSRLFLRGINKYGIYVKTANKVSKFIFEEITTSLSINSSNYIEPLSSNGTCSYNLQYESRNNGGYIFFMVYGISLLVIKNDISKGVFV